MDKPTIGIIGFGDFTKLMVKYLAPHAKILVASRKPIMDKGGLDFVQVDHGEVLQQTIIIPSVPAQFIADVFEGENINPDALVIDVCSVKVKPVEALLRVLPKSVSIIATHPMFGPASAANGLKDKPMMMHPTRVKADMYEKVKVFCRDTLGLRIVECTPEEHDRMMAYVQGLSHYIGRVMQCMDIPESELATRAYEDLLDMKKIQGGDSWELFESIMFENPYAIEVNKKFKQSMDELDRKLKLP